MLRRAMLTLSCVMLLTLMPPINTHAQTSERCFPETGFCITGPIRRFWERNGGLPIFGFPIAQQREEIIEGRPFQVQWFERERFEIHPENRPPYDVLLGRLGEEVLRRQGRDWWTFPKGQPQPGCQFFEATSHTVCEPFLSYWRTHGLEFDGREGKSYQESLALFGYPLSEPAMETNSSGFTVLTQWFERARFEYLPDNPDPYKVLLGLLGNELSTKQPSSLCLEFEAPLAVGTQYGAPVGQHPGDVAFTINGVQAAVYDFTFLSGGGTFGYAQVDTAPVPFGSGQSIRFNNINLEFDFSGIGFVPAQVSFEFLDLGGIENLSVNGSSPLFVGDLPSAPSPIGGASLAVSTSPVTGGKTGTVTLAGSVKTLRIGGQEFWIDKLCVSSRPNASCLEFEAPLAVGTQYGAPVGQHPGDVAFTSGGVRVLVDKFDFIAGGGTFNYAQIDLAPRTFSIGQSIRLNNINIVFDLSGIGFPVKHVSFDYLDLGGSENLSINGSPSYAGDIGSAPGTIAGVGVSVSATPVQGGKSGTVKLTGPVTIFSTGGQEYWVDHVCAME